MANTPDQNQDPISLAWNKSRQLRDELAAKAGKPDNLETGVGDALLGFTGSTLTNTGSTIKNLSLGDASRAMRATADGSYMQGNVDSAVDMVTGGDIQKTREQGKGLLTDALGLVDVQFVGVDPSKNPVKEAVGNVIGKAASAGTAVADSIDQNIVKPVVEPVGKAIQSGGEGLKNLRSDDAKLADQSKFYTQDKDGNYHFGDAWSDPAKFVTRAVDVFGSLAPTILSGLITKGAVAPMVTKSMLKRGLSAEAAAVIGKATADRVAQNVVLAGGIGMSVGQSKDQAREAVSGLSYEELMSSPTFRENVRLVNEDPNNQTLSSTQRLEFARERTAEQAASYAGSDPTTYAGAVAGTVLGDAYLFKMITGKKEAAQVTGNILARTAKGFFKGGVGEGTGEAIEEGLQKNIANRASNEVGGTNIDPWEGAGLAALEAGTLGVLSGGAVGSVSADIHGSSKPAADTTTNTATPPTGPQTTTPSNVAGEVDVNTAIKEVSEGRKVAGSFSIGKGPEGYRAAYINQGGELRVTKPFATAEEAQQAVTGNANAVRQDVSLQPQNDAQASPQPDDLANIPAFMRNGQELSPELEKARSQAINNAWQDQSAQQSSAQAGVLQPRDVQVTGNPDEPAFLRTQQNNPTGRDTSTLQDANPYTDAQAALAKGGAPTADDLIKQSIQNGNQGKTPQEAGLTGDLLLAKQQPNVPATTEQNSGATVDGQADEVIPESRGLGYNNQINMPGKPGNGINDNYVPPITQDRTTSDKTLGIESTRDPRSPVAQSIAQAGTESDSIFGQLKSLRVTKRGKPFSSVKEAQLASRKTETPIELPTGGYGVVDKAELELVQKQAELNKWNQARIEAGLAPFTNERPSEEDADLEVWGKALNEWANEEANQSINDISAIDGKNNQQNKDWIAVDQNEREDGKTELLSNGLRLFHGSSNADLTLDDIQIVRSNQKQGKKGRSYGGFYGSVEDDISNAERYANMSGNPGTMYEANIAPGTKVLHKVGDVTRLSERYIDELRSQGYGLVVGRDPTGRHTEYAVIDKSAISGFGKKGEVKSQSTATITNDNINTLGVNDTNASDINQTADSAIKNVLSVKTEKQSNYDGSSTYRFSFNDGHASVLTHSDGTAHIMDVQIGDGETAGLRGKGVGTKLYEHIGNELAKDGVTLESTRWSKHKSAISPAALRVWEKLEKAGAARVVGHENARVLDRFSGVNEVRDIPIYEFTSAGKEASQATVKQIDANESTSTPVIAQSQPNLNVNESSNGQANANQPIADQAVGAPSPETVTAPVVAKESQPQPASNVEQISESYLKDVDLLKEHAGKWKYRYAVGANWQTANSKESAIERAKEAHQKAIANSDPLPTKAERYATSEAEQAAQMEQRYGKMSIPELEKEHARLGGVVSDLQQTGKNEFNGNGGRRTGAATANEGARDTGLEKMRLEGYIQTRKEREADNKTESYDERLNSRQERIKSATSNKEIDKVIAEQEADTERDWDTTRSLGIKAENRKRQIESHEDQQKTNEMLDAGKSVYATSFKSGQAANSYVEKKNKEDPDFEYTLHEPTMERQHTDFGEVTDSDWRVTKKRRNTSKPEKTIEDHFKDLAKYQSGEMDFDEFKQAASDFLDNEESVKAKLAALTKPEILKRMGPMFNYNHKGDKKDVIVDAAYQSLAGQLRFAAHGDKDVITETVSFEEIQGKRARKTTASKAREEISALTSEKYGIYQEKAKAATKKAEERFQKVKQQISDPQTLDDFETFLNYRSIDKLTPEQKARYEDLKAERNLDKRDQAAAAAKETKVVPTATGDIVKTKHTKEGHDLFVVKLADRVDRDAYTTINAKAKELGGYYSKFRGNGAVPGFQFRTEEQAKEFQQWLSNAGNQTTSVEDVKATTDITAEPEVTSDESSKKKQADKLRDRAASVREKAQAELNADRKSNTVKRAREAAYAVARAEADLRFANILDAIANGIEAGEIKYLRNMTAGTQLETLDTVLRRIVRSNKMSQAIRDDLIQKGYLRKGDDAELSWTDSAPIEVITQYAEMPGMDYWANILRDTAKNMQTTAGFKQAGVKIMNQVLMAINAENRMVTISDPDLIDKLKQFSKQHEVRDYLKDTMADYDRLVRMGITSPIELRAALRELHKVKQSLKGTQPKRDPVKQKEDALKMRLLNNRNAFVDFFPTPDEHANDVIARAGIEPGMRVLEPSAGHGALAVAARDAGATVDAVELSNDLRDILTEKGFNLVGSDFMATEPAGEYDAVVMNPPFSNDMDIDHVKHAYAHLKPGGRLVAIVSSMAGERSNNKNKQFKEWLDSLGATEEMMPEGSFKNSMNPTSVRTKIIELQKPADSENVKPQPMGSRVTIHTPKGKPVEVQYQLVSAADLVASNEFDGRVNKSYPQELQPRDRTKASYQQQVNQIAANPEGSRLAGSPESDRGAPIVRDLVVESGNGRTIGIKQAYKQGTATEYRDYLIKHADEFGFTADDVNLIDDPVLARQRVSDLSPEERLDFVVDSNTDAKMANSATEDAKSDARYLDNGMMDLLNIPEGGDLLASSNERFLSSFATKLGVNSLNSYKDSAGRWNEAFRKRVSNAIFAYGYDNDTLLKAATGDTSEAGKNLTNALMNNAASVAELRSMVPETAKAFVNYLAEGIDVMTSAKRNGQSIQEVVNQGDMLSGGVSHYGGAIAEMLSDASRSGKRLTETLNQITGMLNESAKAADQIDLLTGEPTQQVTAEEAINAAEKDFNERKQQEQRVQPSQDLFGANSARIGDNNGSGTSVSRPVSASETKSAGENSRLNLVNGLLGGETEKVQFSKMPLNAAEKSGKGMTKPEAELAAKEWLKQFKSDINVVVAKDDAGFIDQMERLGHQVDTHEGETLNAAYINDSKTLVLNASAIQNAGRLRQLMRHEILVHYGLRNAIGDDAYIKVINALVTGYETSPSIKSAIDSASLNYSSEDLFTQMEEAFAHYAETRPVDKGALGRLWDRVVGMVKSALQKVGLMKANASEAELDSVLKAIAENMRNGMEVNANTNVSDAPLFSREETADNELMSKLGLSPKPNLVEKTKSQIDVLKQTDRKTIKAWIKKVGRQANTQILDALAPIKYAEDSAGQFDAANSAYVAARLSSGSASVMQATMLYGLPEWKDGVVQRKDGTTDRDALLGIFSELGSDLHNWLAWMAGHRAEILMREGRENLLSASDITKLKLKGSGKEAKFNEAKKKWNKLNGAVLDMAQEAGLIKADDRASWESEWYIPFFRETDDGDVTAPFKKNGIANQSSGIKKLKGGTANVNDILENIFQTTSKLIDSSMKNMAAQKVVHNLAETDLISIIDKPNLIDIKAAAQNKQNMMMVKVDGESHVVQVNDPALFKAMTMIDSVIERDPFTKAAMKAKHLITAGVTSGPEFMLRNFLRDAASTWAINEDGFKPMIDSIRGVKKAWKMDDSSINMMFSGASFMGGNLRGTDPEAMASVIRKTLRRKGMSPEKINEYENSLITTGRKAKDVLLHSWEQYERFGEAVENGSREAVYEAAIKAGKSHAQAAFEARDLMDFSMRGSSKIMRWLVDVLPFFNARMQGLGKLGRAMAANPKQIARRGGMIAAASLALLALNWDDDRYNDLPDWDKDMNWHFWLGDQHFRIPKPFEIGLMFGTLPERMVRTMGGKDTAGKFGQVVARNILETFSINPIPQVVKPLTESYFNYDMFRGAPIENMSDLNVAPEARYDERTSLLMRELGQITGLSPKKLEHIVTGYTGTIGAYVVGICDAIVRASGDYGAAPAIRADQIPVLKSIYQGSAPAKSSQAMTDFYQLLDEANQVYSTIRQYQKEGRMGDAQEMLEENRNKLAGRKTMTNAQKQFRQIRNEMELIQRDRNLNSDEKRERIDRLLSKRNNFAAKLIKRFGTEL